MPTVLREGPYRLYFYSHEPNEPAHIHIDRGGATAKYWLHRVHLARSAGFAAHELRRIQRLVEDRREELIHAWDTFFAERR